MSENTFLNRLEIKKELLRPRWTITTALVLIGVAILIRLGIWQLDRLDQRQVFNARVTAQINAPELDLNTGIPVEQFYDMEYRTVTVTGVYDPTQEILLRNQVSKGNQLGFEVLSPLKITGTNLSILVERGWIPFDQADPGKRQQYAEPGQITLTGMVRRPQTQPDFGGVPDPTLAPGESHLDAWNLVNLDQIQKQVPYPLLNMYIQQAPDPSWNRLPERSLPTLDLSEGPHLGYALQWFTFALILGAGYPFFIRRQLQRNVNKEPSRKP